MKSYIDILLETAITEIERNPNPLDDDIHIYERFFKGGVQHSYGGKTIIENNFDGLTFIGLYDQYKFLSFMTVADIDLGHQIDTVMTAPGETQKGWMRLLISWWTSERGPLLSSDQQTAAAEAMWKGLIHNPGNLRLSVYDTISKVKQPLTPASLSSPWDGSHTTVIMVENGGGRIRYRAHELMEGNTTYMWWGTECSPGTYNP